MATYAVSLSFTFGAKNDDKAQELAERIGAYVVQEDMATEFSIIDVELLDDDEDPIKDLDFEDDE